MVGSRTATAVAGLLASLLVSVAAWYLLGTVLVFLVVPFVPLLLRGRRGGAEPEPGVRSCPACGFETADPAFAYCPRDGRPLE